MKIRTIFTGLIITAAIIFAGAGSAHALFDDYEIVSGDISVDRGVNSVIVNVNSDKAIVNINSFNVGLNETIQFNGSNSELLTRVIGGEMSRIDGNLYSNLMLFTLINTAGIYVSDTGNIEARNFILSM